MVDYSFAVNGKGNIKNRVEFFNEDLPPVKTVKDPVVAAKKELEKHKGKIAMLVNEADEFAIKSEDDFKRSVEMRGELKTLIKLLEDQVNRHARPYYDQYKAIRNFGSALTSPLKDADGGLAKKSNQYAYQLEMKRREDEARARKEAAALQAKLDKMQAEQEAAERAAAKKEKREPVEMPPLVVDTPIIPKEIKAKTEHGTVKVAMVLKHEITDIESEFVFKLVLANCKAAYRTLADTAVKKAIKAGALGLAGGPGITVREEADTQHRRR